MSTIAEGKIASENFINDALNNEKIELLNDSENESQKLIMEELSTEKESDLNIKDSTTLKSYDKAPENTDSVLENSNNLTNHTEALQNDISNISTISSSNEHIKEVKNEMESNENATEIEVKEDSNLNNEQEDEWIDLLGSGVILKKIIKRGDAETRPKRSDQCYINYTCQLEDSDESTFIEQADNFKMCLGEADVVQGLDVAVGLMTKGERCILKIQSRLAFGDKGFPPNIPGKATVVYDIELIDLKEEEDFDSLSIQERCHIGNKKRERGNWWYKRGENTLAIQCYRRALDFLDEVESERDAYKPTDSELQKLLEDRLKVLNNMASAQIKMELYDQALTSLQTVLRCQPENVKALYRKAKIHISKNDLAQALQLLEKAKIIEPADSTIAKEIQTVNASIEKQKHSEREYARRMFGGPSAATTSTKKSPVSKSNKKSSNNKFQIWTSLGATLVLGLAGIIAYKLKYA